MASSLIMELLSRTVTSFFPRLKFVVHELFVTLVVNGVAVPLDLQFKAESFTQSQEFEKELARVWQQKVKRLIDYTLTRPLVTVHLKRELWEYPGVSEKVTEAFKRFCAGKVLRLSIKQT